MSCVTVSALHLRTLPQGPRVSSKSGVCNICHRIGCTDFPLRTLATLVSELSYPLIQDQRLLRIVQQRGELACFWQRQDLLATE